MAKGNSGISGNNALEKQAAERMKGVTGYSVEVNGEKMNYFFHTVDGETYMSNDLGAIPGEIPGGLSEREVISRLKQNGENFTKYTNKQLVSMEVERLKEREEMNTFLNRETARNRHADLGEKQYRNTRKSIRIQRRQYK